MQTEQSALCRCRFHCADRTLRSDRAEGPRHETARSFSASFCGNLGQEKRSAWGAEAGGGGPRLERRVSAGLRVLADLGGKKKKKAPANQCTSQSTAG